MRKIPEKLPGTTRKSVRLGVLCGTAWVLWGVWGGTAAEASAHERSPERTIVVKLTADSANDGFEPWRAMDGNPETMWHTQFNAPPGGTTGSAIPISCGYG
ncbi:MAG: hypothetical protein Q4C47_09900, partial [Planctomycetia bacterium]|nr:hypothetical protein [Planctomycetia bacterium]